LRAGALLIGGDALFLSRRVQLAILAARYGVPAIYNTPEFPAAGDLMSYGYNLTDAYRHAGVYTAKVLKGARPADLPVQQETKAELVINLKTARDNARWGGAQRSSVTGSWLGRSRGCSRL